MIWDDDICLHFASFDFDAFLFRLFAECAGEPIMCGGRRESADPVCSALEASRASNRAFVRTPRYTHTHIQRHLLVGYCCKSTHSSITRPVDSLSARAPREPIAVAGDLILQFAAAGEKNYDDRTTFEKFGRAANRGRRWSRGDLVVRVSAVVYWESSPLRRRRRCVVPLPRRRRNGGTVAGTAFDAASIPAHRRGKLAVLKSHVFTSHG